MVNRFVIATCVLLVACGSERSIEHADAGEPSTADAGHADAKSTEGFGRIAGDCGALAGHIVSSSPGLFHLAIDFDRLYTNADLSQLTMGGQEILADGNAGGSSVLSEVFAYEVLQRCEGAELLKTETEIIYDQSGKITDFLAKVDAEKLGVSVTRAVAYPFDSDYSIAQATGLLEGKLADILVSSANVSALDRWRKQALAILAYGPAHADTLTTAYEDIDSELKADTLILIIVTNGPDDFIYCDGPCQ